MPGAERFMPSLLPRWLYDTMDVGLMPAPTKKSTSTDFILVCTCIVCVSSRVKAG